MTSLTAIFGHARGDARDSEKLLELYWNRAELKKEFANLRNETYRLKDQVREQKGHAARAQQQLLQLENLLLDPEWVHSIALHYRLRALHVHLECKLARFAEQLKQQREQREYRRLLAGWKEERRGESADVGARLAEVRQRIGQAAQDLDSVQQKYSATVRILRYFRKRSTKRTLDAIASRIETHQAEERQLLDSLERLRRSGPPDVRGLDVSAKRSINCAILAFAQQVFLHYREDGIAALAREAGMKGAGSVRYGGRTECEPLWLQIKRLQATMPRTSQCADRVTRRARLIAERARFAGEQDAVPEPSSTAIVFDMQDDGQVSELEANLLGDNYFGLAKALSR